jgi:hypothetical protein
MEIYNDALERSASEFSPGDELFDRGLAEVANRESATELLLPALEAKQALLDAMAIKQVLFESKGLPLFAKAVHDDWVTAIGLMLARSRFMLDALRSWLADPTSDGPDLRSLDAEESAASARANAGVTELYRRLGLGFDDWLAASGEAIDALRVDAGRPPLGLLEYRRRFERGIAGERVRLFS